MHPRQANMIRTYFKVRRAPAPPRPPCITDIPHSCAAGTSQYRRVQLIVTHFIYRGGKNVAFPFSTVADPRRALFTCSLHLSLRISFSYLLPSILRPLFSFPSSFFYTGPTSISAPLFASTPAWTAEPSFPFSLRQARGTIPWKRVGNLSRNDCAPRNPINALHCCCEPRLIAAEKNPGVAPGTSLAGVFRAVPQRCGGARDYSSQVTIIFSRIVTPRFSETVDASATKTLVDVSAIWDPETSVLVRLDA